MTFKIRVKHFLFFRVPYTLLLVFLLCIGHQGQIFSQTTVRGFVRDSISGKTLPGTNIYFEDTESAIYKANNNGFFEITDTTGSKAIIISGINYKTKKIPIVANRPNAVDVLLPPQQNDMEYLIHKYTEEPYSEENNPAILFIQEVIANKNKNQVENTPVYQYESYEKMAISIDDVINTLKNSKLLSKIEPAFNDLEVSDFSGQPVLTISMHEILSEEYRRSDPKAAKSIISAETHEGMDRSTITQGLMGIWNETFNDINIFDDKIPFLLKEFNSPLSLSNTSKDYKYFFEDTVQYKEDSCAIIFFMPSDLQKPGFAGRLWITLDGNYTVKKISLIIPQGSGFNYIEQMQINQEYEKQAEGSWAKSYESVTVRLSGLKVLYDLYAKRERFNFNYKPGNPSDPAYQLPEDQIALRGSEYQTDSFWVAHRPIPLKVKSQEAKDAEKAFGNSPLFRSILFSMKILTSGYVQTNGSKDKNKFDIGPVGTFFSSNEIEGIRLKLGGETTSNLNRYFYLKGFGAYGFKDGVFKYSGTGIWSINGKHPERDYGIHTLSFNYEYDVHTPGEQFFFTDKDNVILSFKRLKDDKMTYQKKGLLTYEKENDNGLSIRTWTSFQNEEATGSLQFLTSDEQGNITDIGNFNSSEVGIRIQYAHNNSVFYQKGNTRIPFSRSAPVFYLTYSQGIKGYLNGDYNYQFAEFSVSKIFWMSTFGRIDCIARTGKIWGDLPFPLLVLPNANLSYYMLPEAYNMLSPIEFINDKYVSLSTAFHFNGVLLHKISFLERLNLREVVSFKGLYGSLSDNNLPENNHSLFLFPENSRKMGKDPYMEASIGIENIFRVLRLDYVRRLTYLNDPGTSKGGVRFSLRFSF